MNRLKVPIFLLIVISLSSVHSVHASSFLFGSGGVQNTIFGLPHAEIENEDVRLSLQAGPSGSRFDDSDSQGLGINSLDASAGINDPDSAKINFITGHPSGVKVAETFSFSFNRPGVLEDLLFDGVKDETLEYFSLTFPNGNVITIFDSQTRFRLGIQGYLLSDLNVANPIECQTENDDLTDINYSFQAGDVFTLTYGEGDYSLVPNYHTNPRFPQFPNAVGDGSRFQGVVITVIPEPAAAIMGLFALACYLPCRPRNRQRMIGDSFARTTRGLIF